MSPQLVRTIAIDPGKSGGIAVQYPDGSIVLHEMPKTESDVVDLLREIVDQSKLEEHAIQAVLERVGGFVGRGQPGSSAFVFGRSVGLLVGTLSAFRIPQREVTPQAWQKGIGAGTSRRFPSKNAWKRHLLDLAKKQFPSVQGLTLRTADALLILHYTNTSHEASTSR